MFIRSNCAVPYFKRLSASNFGISIDNFLSKNKIYLQNFWSNAQDVTTS